MLCLTLVGKLDVSHIVLLYGTEVVMDGMTNQSPSSAENK